MQVSHEGPTRQQLNRMLDDANAENATLRAALERISSEWLWSPIIEDSPNAHVANQIICQMQAIATEAITKTLAWPDYKPSAESAARLLVTYSLSQGYDRNLIRLTHPDPDGGVDRWVVEVRPAGSPPDETKLERLSRIEAAARRIKHWHDTLPNPGTGECDGMVVSAQAVRDLWGALGDEPKPTEVKATEMTWRPIDIAPKGELVLVRNESGRCDVCYQTNNGEPFLETWRYQDGTQAGWPTHWMPLPQPPR